MIKHTCSKTKVTGAVLGALTAGALAIGGLGMAPAANATCASLFGINSGGQCTSTLTSVAIALGTNAEAHADGLFGAAFAIGDGNTAAIVGVNSSPSGKAFGVALSVGGSNNHVEDQGLFSAAVNFLGDNNTVVGGAKAPVIGFMSYIPGIASLAFNAFGSGNTVTAGNGLFVPFAIAGSVGQSGQTVQANKPGININNTLVVGGAAAVHPASNRITKPAAATRTTARPAAARGASAAKK
jgi:hypothetical protein